MWSATRKFTSASAIEAPSITVFCSKMKGVSTAPMFLTPSRTPTPAASRRSAPAPTRRFGCAPFDQQRLRVPP